MFHVKHRNLSYIDISTCQLFPKLFKSPLKMLTLVGGSTPNSRKNFIWSNPLSAGKALQYLITY